MHPYKFGTVSSPDALAEHRHANTWHLEETTGPSRLVIAPAAGHVALMLALAEHLPEPFGVLYVLLVSRCGNEEGRYQGPFQMDRAWVHAFLSKYRTYLESDGRHHIWVESLPGDGLLVYDNHNVIYAYGPIEQYVDTLRMKGFTEELVRFPEPHVHRYNQEFDRDETAILAHWEWKHFRLEDGD
jgi:hypothetical protein